MTFKISCTPEAVDFVLELEELVAAWSMRQKLAAVERAAVGWPTFALAVLANAVYLRPNAEPQPNADAIELAVENVAIEKNITVNFHTRQKYPKSL